METTSEKIRAEKQPKKEPYNPEKQNFLNKHANFSNDDLIKEQLFESQFQTKLMRKIKEDINIIKWIVLISFIASILLGLFISSLD